MIAARVFGIENFKRMREDIRLKARESYSEIAYRTRKQYEMIHREMPVLTGNLRSALLFELDPVQMRATIKLLATGPYGTTDYFPCWDTTHKSIAEHSDAEISHAKARGAMGIRANPMALPGGSSDIQKDPFVRSLSKLGFTSIKVIESGPKGKQRTYDAKPPKGWPHFGKK